MNPDLLAALAGEVVVAPRSHPELARSLSHLLTSGLVVAILPGVYAPRHLASDWRVVARAACLWDPNAVLVGDAAAALTFWPELVPRAVTVAGKRTGMTRPGLNFAQRIIPPELVEHRGGLRFTVREFTAIDLAAERGGESIDRALRSRTVTLAGMYQALRPTPCRPGNRDRRLIMLDSRDEPWSAAERLAHRLFRRTGITGWRANVPFRFEDRSYFLDMGFRHKPLVVEIDGRIHLTPGVFDIARLRGNDLVLAGKHTLHFTYRMLQDDDRMVVDTTIRALALW